MDHRDKSDPAGDWWRADALLQGLIGCHRHVRPDPERHWAALAPRPSLRQRLAGHRALRPIGVRTAKAR